MCVKCNRIDYVFFFVKKLNFKIFFFDNTCIYWEGRKKEQLKKATHYEIK